MFSFLVKKYLPNCCHYSTTSMMIIINDDTEYSVLHPQKSLKNSIIISIELLFNSIKKCDNNIYNMCNLLSLSVEWLRVSLSLQDSPQRWRSKKVKNDLAVIIQTYHLRAYTESTHSVQILYKFRGSIFFVVQV